MRALNQEELEERKKKVMQFVVHEYIRTGKPVGSHAIAATSRLGLSSATIRNIFADLKRDEMIVQPHTSAGSTPTDKGYRLYVDSLIELQRLAVQEQTRIDHEYEARIKQVEDLMAQTSRMLSSLSHYTGFVITPKLDKNLLAHLELIPVGEKKLLVAMITDSGLSKHFVINTGIEIPRDRLRKIARFINENLKTYSLQDVQSKLVERIEDAEIEIREFLALANEIAQEIRKVSASEIYMDGASNMLALPDLSRNDEVHDLFKMIEEKQILTDLLENEIRDECESMPGKAAGPSAKLRRTEKKSALSLPAHYKVHVRIGSENPVKAMQNLSLISSAYQLSDRTVGVLGILGPKRMEYPKMIALVDYVSQLVNRLVKEMDKRG